MLPELSVIIPSYRRQEPLELCLEDLAQQQTDLPFEVVLVLQAYPGGAAAQLLERYDSRLRLRLAEFAEGLGTSAARNAGLRLASGAIVAFLDDDVRLPRAWVDELIPYYSDPSLGGVGGFVDHPGHFNPARVALYRVLGLAGGRYRIDWGGFNIGPASLPAEDQPADWLSGGNMSFRRAAIEAAGGFDEALGSFWHEDVDVSHRIAKSGWRVLASPRLAVRHFPNPINRPPLYQQVRERERSRVLFVWKALGNRRLWELRYASRLVLHALAMGVIGLAKLDPRIPLNVLRGGWEGYRGLAQARRDSAERQERPA